MRMMLKNLVHPYIQSTTVLCNKNSEVIAVLSLTSAVRVEECLSEVNEPSSVTHASQLGPGGLARNKEHVHHLSK